MIDSRMMEVGCFHPIPFSSFIILLSIILPISAPVIALGHSESRSASGIY